MKPVSGFLPIFSVHWKFDTVRFDRAEQQRSPNRRGSAIIKRVKLSQLRRKPAGKPQNHSSTEKKCGWIAVAGQFLRAATSDRDCCHPLRSPTDLPGGLFTREHPIHGSIGSSSSLFGYQLQLLDGVALHSRRFYAHR